MRICADFWGRPGTFVLKVIWQGVEQETSTVTSVHLVSAVLRMTGVTVYDSRKYRNISGKKNCYVIMQRIACGCYPLW